MGEPAMESIYRNVITMIIFTAAAVGFVSGEFVLGTLLLSTASLYGYVGR